MSKKYFISMFIIGFLLLGSILLMSHYEIYNMAKNNEYLAVKTSGCLDIIYSDSEEVSLLSPKAVSDEDGMTSIPRTITINNMCNSEEAISLYFDVYNDSTIDDSKIKVYLNGDVDKDVSFLSDIDNVLGNNNVLKTYKMVKTSIKAKETKRFNMRIYLDHDATLTPEKNYFHGKYYIASNKIISIDSFNETLLKNGYRSDIDYNNLVDSGLYKIDNSYYYRGNVNNNNVKFANHLWKIVAINEDGTIKLIYAENDLKSNYNDSTKKEEDLEYKDSVIANYLQKFYDENLKEFDKYIVNSNYCNDTTGLKNYRLYYGAYNRNIKSSNPILNCLDTDKEYGGVIASKIGLLTLDQLTIAGANSKNDNTDFYLYDGNDFFTMSPAFKASYAWIGILTSSGRIDASYTNVAREVRPVINIISSINVSGNGTITNPYIIN